MAAMRLCGVVFLAAVSCGRSASAPPSSPPAPLPAAAAGISSEIGPGIPDGFRGTITHSIELTAAEKAAIENANRLSEARAAHSRIHSSLIGGSP